MFENMTNKELMKNEIYKELVLRTPEEVVLHIEEYEALSEHDLGAVLGIKFISFLRAILAVPCTNFDMNDYSKVMNFIKKKIQEG